MESLICNFYLSVAARKIVWADPSLRYTRMLLGRLATNKQTTPPTQRCFHSAFRWRLTWIYSGLGNPGGVFGLNNLSQRIRIYATFDQGKNEPTVIAFSFQPTVSLAVYLDHLGLDGSCQYCAILTKTSVMQHVIRRLACTTNHAIAAPTALGNLNGGMLCIRKRLKHRNMSEEHRNNSRLNHFWSCDLEHTVRSVFVDVVDMFWQKD